MLTIARLFGKSPFAPLQTHMNKVASCIEKLTKIYECLVKQEIDKIERLVQDLSHLEHEADITKNDIRNHLPKNIFMPIDRTHFLEILAVQDAIADTAEEIGIMLTYEIPESFTLFQNELSSFFLKCIETFWESKHIIEEIDELLESSFGGIEAEKVKSMVEQTAFKEHQATIMKRTLLKKLYTQGKTLPASAFHFWLTLTESIGNLAKEAEKLANRIRMILELK